jgi:hypothetical protein
MTPKVPSPPLANGASGWYDRAAIRKVKISGLLG